MKTQIFEYKGNVGITAGNKFVNNPTQPGQLGVIVELSEVEISRPALEILKKVRKGRDAIGDVMCWKTATKEGACFGWLGGPAYWLHENAEADRNYQPELLESRVTEIEAPEAFKQAVENKKGKQK